MDAGLSEHFNVLIRNFHRAASPRHLTQLHETVENMNIALDSVQRSETEVHKSAVGAPVLRKESV